jgi:hypothetical protein
MEKAYRIRSTRNGKAALEVQSVTADKRNVLFKGTLEYIVQNSLIKTIDHVMQDLIRTLEVRTDCYLALKRKGEILRLRKRISAFMWYQIDLFFKERGYKVQDFQIIEITFIRRPRVNHGLTKRALSKKNRQPF